MFVYHNRHRNSNSESKSAYQFLQLLHLIAEQQLQLLQRERLILMHGHLQQD